MDTCVEFALCKAVVQSLIHIISYHIISYLCKQIQPSPSHNINRIIAQARASKILYPYKAHQALLTQSSEQGHGDDAHQTKLTCCCAHTIQTRCHIQKFAIGDRVDLLYECVDVGAVVVVVVVGVVMLLEVAVLFRLIA